MATDNIAVVRRLVEEVWNKGNLGAIGEVLSSDFVGYEPIVGEVRGPAAFEQQVKMFRSAFPDLSLQIDDIGVAGDRVFLRWTGRGTHRGSFLGSSPTNGAGKLHGISIHHVVGGKIVEHHESYDSLQLLQIVGLVPPLERLGRGGEAKRPQAAAPRG